MTDLRYPIGTFVAPETLTLEEVQNWTRQIAELPARVREAVSGLSEAQQDTPYREGGWSVRQVVHHLFDSHANGFIRLKLALTEEQPTVKPYPEQAFAELPDSRLPVEVSLSLLEGLHTRWVALLESLSEQDLERGYLHPGLGRFVPLGEFVGMYAHHGRNHTAQITALRQRMGW